MLRNKFNLFLVGMLALLTSSCNSPGEITTKHDPYTGGKVMTLSLGHFESLEQPGLIKDMWGNLEQTENSLTSTPDYLLEVITYGEGDGTQCACAEKGGRVIFLIDEKKTEIAVKEDANTLERRPGFLAPGCQELVKVGPLPQTLINDIITARDVRFKLYGNRYNIEGKMKPEQITEIHKFVKKGN